MKYRVIVADPPWAFGDLLAHSPTSVKRGAAAQYATLTTAELAALQVGTLAQDDALIALWCPATLIPDGLHVLAGWGFDFKQVWIWAKTRKPKGLGDWLGQMADKVADTPGTARFPDLWMPDGMAFGMGRLARSCKELLLVGTRGSIYQHLRTKSERDLVFAPATKHSVKPEALQDKLERMLPGPYLELFARRDRPGWDCCGLECPSTAGEEVRASIVRLNNQ